MPDDATVQLKAATINHLLAPDPPVTALMFGCSGTQIYDPEGRDEGSGHRGDLMAQSRPPSRRR